MNGFQLITVSAHTHNVSHSCNYYGSIGNGADKDVIIILHSNILRNVIIIHLGKVQIIIINSKTPIIHSIIKNLTTSFVRSSLEQPPKMQVMNN